MKLKDFRERLVEGTFTRREFTRVLASAGVVATVLPFTSQKAQAAVNLKIFEWSGYEIPELYPAFLEKYGEAPEFPIFGDEDEAFAKMIAGFKVDMAHPCMPAIRTWRDAGLIKPIDPARIEAWDNIFPELLTIRGMQHGGDHWLLPWDWGASSIVYRTDLVDIEEESYALLLDERYQGRMAMYDYVDEAFPVAALLSGAEDHLDMTDEELERAADVLRQIHKNMLFYWEERTTLWQAMASGEIVAAFAWNDAIVELKKQGVPVKFMIPKEGVLSWVCGYTLMADASGSEDQAYDYLNAVMEPRVGKFLIEDYGYGHANKESYDLVSQETLEDLGLSDIENFLANSKFEGGIPPATREKMMLLWTEIKAGF